MLKVSALSGECGARYFTYRQRAIHTHTHTRQRTSTQHTGSSSCRHGYGFPPHCVHPVISLNFLWNRAVAVVTVIVWKVRRSDRRAWLFEQWCCHRSR